MLIVLVSILLTDGLCYLISDFALWADWDQSISLPDKPLLSRLPLPPQIRDREKAAGEDDLHLGHFLFLSLEQSDMSHSEEILLSHFSN